MTAQERLCAFHAVYARSAKPLRSRPEWVRSDHMDEVSEPQDSGESSVEAKPHHTILCIPPEHEGRLDHIVGLLHTEHREVLFGQQFTVKAALRVAALLVEAKQLLKDKFDDWVSIHAPFSPRQARKYLRAHDRALEMGINPIDPEDSQIPPTLQALLSESDKTDIRNSSSKIPDSHNPDEVSDPRLPDDEPLSNPRKPSKKQADADLTDDEEPQTRGSEPGDHDQYLDDDYSPPPGTRTPETTALRDASSKRPKRSPSEIVADLVIPSSAVLEEDFPTVWEYLQSANDFLETLGPMCGDKGLGYTFGREIASLGASSAGIGPKDLLRQLTGVINFAERARKLITALSDGEGE